MKHKILFIILILSSYTMNAQTEIPLLDRELFFGNPEITLGQISPDGNSISFVKEYNGILNIWVKKFDQKFEDARLLTNSTSPITNYFWTEDSRYILYLNDEGGNENYNIYAVDPSAPAEGEVPPSRNLTPMEDVTVQIFQVSKKNPDKLIVGINDRDASWHDLYELTVSNGTLKKLRENLDRYTGWEFDWDENLRLVYQTDENGNSHILSVLPDGTFSDIYSTDINEEAYVQGWTPDNKYCYLVSNKGDVNLSTLYKMNPEDGSVTFMESDPRNQVDFGGMFIDDNSREILYTSYVYDKRERNWKNKEWEKNYQYLVSKFPDREIGFLSFDKDYKKMLISAASDNKATEVYYFNPDTKDLILQYIPNPQLKEQEQYLSTMQAVSYPSSDGLMIPAYLSLPPGKTPKNLPLVMLIHGGPKGPRDYWGYDPYVQMLNNRGYAVLQPNFRASGGYGKKFLNAGDKQWGRLMQDDITWGVKYLTDKGIADPKNVAIMGGSYGGYATLAGLAFTPELYKCGVDIVGPSNLFTLLSSIPAYWESGRKWLYEMIGDPDTEEGKKLIHDASPLFSVDKMDKPLMIVQGANDPRVKQAESDQIVIALRDKGQDVEYLLAQDEGHGYRKPLNRQAMWAEAEKFLAQHLGGRYQKDMPADVAATLKKITVDPATVTYTPPQEVSVTEELPQNKVTLSANSNTFDISIQAQEQSLDAKGSRQIESYNSGWRISETSKGSFGEMSDVAVYDSYMRPIQRSISQGGQVINIKYDEDKVSVEAMGQKMEASAEGPFVVDGAGYDIFIDNLGLQDGAQISYYILDMTTMQPQAISLSHKGTKEYNGKNYQYYEAVAIDKPAQISKFWIDPDAHSAVHIEQVLPSLGNATMKMDIAL